MEEGKMTSKPYDAKYFQMLRSTIPQAHFNLRPGDLVKGSRNGRSFSGFITKADRFEMSEKWYTVETADAVIRIEAADIQSFTKAANIPGRNLIQLSEDSILLVLGAKKRGEAEAAISQGCRMIQSKVRASVYEVKGGAVIAEIRPDTRLGSGALKMFALDLCEAAIEMRKVLMGLDVRTWIFPRTAKDRRRIENCGIRRGAIAQ
jgi:hypothetical protein